MNTSTSHERQVTRGRHGHILTNTGVWSPDGEWIVYDIRSDAAGDRFDGTRIEMVHVRTGEVKVLYESKNGAHCGVATFHPVEPKVIFILGPENPTADWTYGPSHRQGVILDVARPGVVRNLDARDLTPPFTAGALRGGSHVHVWDAQGKWVSFTYEDHILGRFTAAGPDHDINQRNIGVSIPGHAVHVSPTHPRNHDGDFFSVIVTRTTAMPRAGSDDIGKAFEESWIGTEGYLRTNGARARHALAFQGNVLGPSGQIISEVFVVDLPDDLTISGESPLQGTERRMPAPPKGTTQRRVTFTANRAYPGIQGPRHWLRSSPDGQRIAFLMKDDAGVVQIWTISPNGGEPTQLTHNHWPIASAFNWSPDGKAIAHLMDNSVCITDAATGETHRITQRTENEPAPRPEACVFSPSGRDVAYVRPVREGGEVYNQIFVARVGSGK